MGGFFQRDQNTSNAISWEETRSFSSEQRASPTSQEIYNIMAHGLQPTISAAEYRALTSKKKPAPGRSKQGIRPDISPDIHFRSSWESNFARYLNLLIKMGVVEWWKYESRTFWFDGIKRGTNSYKIDFEVKYKGDPKVEYVEIKGHEVAKDRTKWRRMKKYHPDIRLQVIGKREYAWIKEKWAGAIPAWE